jgi:Big-like domain-containing protein
VTSKPPVRFALAAVAALALALIPTALAGKPGGGGGGGKGSCTHKTPGLVVDNTWQWGSPGSFGLPGQQLKYAIDVINYDAGCGSSSFVVTVSAPSGFSVSFPTSTITLRSAASGYLWANVTSPSGSTDSDYPLTVTVQRAGSTDSASTTTWYKVYSSDSVAPTLYWPSPADGAAVSGRSYNIAVSSNDDRAVKNVDLYIDGAFVTTKTCDDVSYSCSLNYSWATSTGTHTATFKAYDWMGNTSTMTSTFTVA